MNRVTHSLVMVVEEDEPLRGVLRSALEEEGYDVLLGSALPSAEEIVDARPDLLILDTPRARTAEGWQLVQELKATPRVASMPIVVCSGGDGAFVNQQDVRVRAQAAAVLASPADLDNLLPVVATALATHPLRAIETLLGDPAAQDPFYTGGIPT